LLETFLDILWTTTIRELIHTQITTTFIHLLQHVLTVHGNQHGHHMITNELLEDDINFNAYQQ